MLIYIVFSVLILIILAMINFKVNDVERVKKLELVLTIIYIIVAFLVSAIYRYYNMNLQIFWVLCMQLIVFGLFYYVTDFIKYLRNKNDIELSKKTN